MTITLDQATEQLLQRELDRGSYNGPSDVIARALHVLQAQADDSWILRNADVLNAAIEESYAALERGGGYSPQEVEARLAARHEARKSKAA